MTTGDTSPPDHPHRRAAHLDPGSPLEGIVNAALDDMKAVNVKVMDVRHSPTSPMSWSSPPAIPTATCDPSPIAWSQFAKQNDFRPLGVEGAREGEWVLVDLNDIVVHVMLPRVREFYGLEKLWEDDAAPAVAMTMRSRRAARKCRAPRQGRARKRAPRRKPTS